MLVRGLFLLSVLVLISCAKTFPDPVNDFVKQYPDYTNPQAIWDSFKQQYNRSYASNDEEQTRFGIFLDNIKKATKINAKDPRANYGITRYMDWTSDEFQARLLMTQTEDLKSKSFPPTGKQTYNISSIGIPSAFDWRNEGVVTGVYNQGSCGSCWAFSVTENIESRWAIAGHGLDNLSVQQIIDCCDEAQMGCAGGDPVEAYECIYDYGGQDAWQDYPYSGTDGTCHFEKAWVEAAISGFQYATQSGNEEQMLDYLYSNGPLSACVDASNWQYYSGGIVGPDGCGTSLDHCIQITGFDVGNNPPYWWIRNSWGDWGPYGGYIALEYGTNTCGLAELVTSSIPA